MSTGLATIEPRFGFNEMVQISEVASKSGLFKMTPPQILTLMMLCESEGLHPIKALQLYDIIDGRPALKAVALLARFLESGGSVDWLEQSATAAEATFTHSKTCPKGVTVRYTLDDAKVACLLHKDNWKKNPADMLVARVCSRGAKRANPACILGMDLPEAEEVATAVETTARTSLVTHLASRRESPKESHPAVAETAAELRKAPEVEKPAPAPAEPATAWGKVITDATLHTNQAIAQLAEENPANVGLRSAAIKPQQVINGVLSEFVGRGVIEETRLTNSRGKRDNAMCAATMSSLWDEDSGDVEAAIAKYLTGKIEALMKPAAAPAQGELAMA